MIDFKDDISKQEIPDRTFMRALLKHTGIALALLVPLAAYSSLSHAATGNTVPVDSQTQMNSTESITQPMSVDSVDLKKYAGQWYEIARLPMYFQRNCASDVTATYTLNTDDAGNIKSVNVINACKQEDGSGMEATGLAKPANDTGSELKVTFLPSWLRWLPVGKADYWVLALDKDYKSALVGTPDNKYLWVLSRTPDLSENTYNQYLATAKQQGYDVSELKLTTHTAQ